MKYIVDKYNQMYQTDLTIDDLKYIKSEPQYLGIDSQGNYIQDYKEQTEIEDVVYEDDIDEVYSIINGKTDEIIGSIGMIEEEIKNVDTKVVMGPNGKEYYGAENKINMLQQEPEMKSDEQIYEAVEEYFQRALNRKEKEIGD